MLSIFGLLTLIGTFFAATHAQTITTTDLAGNTIVEVITIDPNQGIPITTTIETIPAAEQAATTTTTDDQQQQQGPVAQPAATQTGLTTFRYTTTDAAGDTLVVTDTFTPSFAPTDTTPAAPTFAGTILSYNQWLSLVGTNTVPVANVAVERWKVSRSILGIGGAVAAGAVGGIWLVVG